MSKVLLTWELGANAGYVNPLGAIAAEMKRRGHDVMVSVRDLAAGEKYLTPLGIKIIQTPVWNGHGNFRLHSAVNYAELLMHAGYLDVEQVSGQIRSWINLIELLKPSMILANHSPSVLLAARVCGIPAVQFGSGFHLPPKLSPMPSMQPWAKVSPQRFISSEEKMLGVINHALHRCNGKPLENLFDVFGGTCYLTTLPETDHYGMREDVAYWGFIQSSQNAVEPVWPVLEGPKVYVYMQSYSRPYKSLIYSLKDLGWPVLVVSRGITEREVKSFNASNIRFSSELVSLGSVAQQADVVATNCNHGTTVELLRRGCKQLVIPLQVEQALLAYRLSNQGLVVSAKPELSDYSNLIKEIYGSFELEDNVKKFHQSYGDMNPQHQLAYLVSDIEGNLSSFP